MAEGKEVTIRTEIQRDAVDVFRQVSYMDRFKCGYSDYLNTPVDFIDDAITIIGLINVKQQPPSKSTPRK